MVINIPNIVKLVQLKFFIRRKMIPNDKTATNKTERIILCVLFN